MLQIYIPSVAGAITRVLSHVIGDLVFPMDDEIKSEAMAVVDLNRREKDDIFWSGLVNADKENVDILYCSSPLSAVTNTKQARELSIEWLKLSNMASSAADRNLIKIPFHTSFSVLHQRRQLNIDPQLTDTTVIEKRFSVESRKFDKSKTSGRFRMLCFRKHTYYYIVLYTAHVLVDLREVGRAVR